MLSFLLSFLLSVFVSTASAEAGDACAAQAGSKDGFNTCLMNPNITPTTFTVVNPGNNTNVSGIILINGTAGSKWKNI